MSRLVREVRAFFSHPLLIGITALLASLAGGIWILVSFGARSLLVAAAAYGACGIGAYVYLRQMRRGVEPGLGTLISSIFAWPFIVILDTYHVMQWGDVPPRFSVSVMPGVEETLSGQGGFQHLGQFGKLDEAVSCARQKAKELGIEVSISDMVRRWTYFVDPAGRIERRKVKREPFIGFE